MPEMADIHHSHIRGWNCEKGQITPVASVEAPVCLVLLRENHPYP